MNGVVGAGHAEDDSANQVSSGRESEEMSQ
jgi:hypothetical protein